MKPKKVHLKQLLPSTADTVALAQAVEERFVEVCSTYLRVRGDLLTPPAGLNQDMLRWRQMRVRHKRGDFRNTEAEIQSVRTIAQWTVDINCKIRNQEPKKIQWEPV